MKKRLVIILTGALVLAAAAALVARALNREPEIEGRPVSAWLNDFRHGTGPVRTRAVEVLRQAGPEAAPYLAHSLGRRPGLLARMNAAFGKYVPEIVKRPLRKVYDPTREILDRYTVAQALQVIGTNGQTAVPELAELLRSPNVLLSTSAGRALAQMGPAAVEPLTLALDSGNFIVRATACDGLGQLGTNAAPAIPRLIKIIESEAGPITASAAFTLSRIGAPAVPHLIPLLSDTNWLVRKQAAHALGFAGPAARAAEPALMAAATDENPEVRNTALEAMGRIDPISKNVVAAADAALENPDATTRAIALQVLRERPRFVRENPERILRLFDDESPEVRGYAALALTAAPSQASNALERLRALAAETNSVVRSRASEALRILTGEPPVR